MTSKAQAPRQLGRCLPIPCRKGESWNSRLSPRTVIRHTAISGIRVVTVHGEIGHAVKGMSSEALPSYDGAAPKPTRRPCVRGCP